MQKMRIMCVTHVTYLYPAAAPYSLSLRDRYILAELVHQVDVTDQHHSIPVAYRESGLKRHVGVRQVT